MADQLEGEALILLGDPEGFALLERALVQAEAFGSPHLIGEASAAVVRAAGPVPPEQASAAMARATSGQRLAPDLPATPSSMSATSFSRRDKEVGHEGDGGLGDQP